MLELLELVQSLKRIPRSGWIAHGVKLDHVESVAQHSLTTSILAMFFADLLRRKGCDIDTEKAVKMALIHDIGEALSFDISRKYLEYLGKAGERLRRRIEVKAIEHALAKLPVKELSKHYSRLLIKEFREEKTIESKVVHLADCIDLLMQIIDYERMGYSKALFDELWDKTADRISDLKIQELSYLLEELERRRRS